jgi:hypothetical protein
VPAAAGGAGPGRDAKPPPQPEWPLRLGVRRVRIRRRPAVSRDRLVESLAAHLLQLPWLLIVPLPRAGLQASAQSPAPAGPRFRVDRVVTGRALAACQAECQV